jgi:hypothetical protein
MRSSAMLDALSAEGADGALAEELSTFGRFIGSRELDCGTAVRFYDAELRAWRVSWSGPGRRRSYSFVAREENGVIEVAGGSEGVELRWTFSELTKSFRWRNEIRESRGEWRLQQAMSVRRSPPGS